MARNDKFRVDSSYEDMGFRSHLFLNEFERSVLGFNSLSRNHRDPYVSDVVDTLSDQFSSMSLLRPKTRPIPTLPSSLEVLSFFLCFTFSQVSFFSSVSHFLHKLHVLVLVWLLQSFRLNGPKTDQRLYGERPKLEPFYELHLSRIRKNEVTKNANFVTLFWLSLYIV